jgi:hypothetical protein
MLFWTVGGLVLVALIFNYINGFHDAANSIATVVSTRVLSPGPSSGRRSSNSSPPRVHGTGADDRRWRDCRHHDA